MEQMKRPFVEDKTTYFTFSGNRIMEKTKTHPCYNGCNHSNARIHLPVAPKCNIQCNYCVRKFDCVNESRPGVTAAVLTPEEALARYKQYKAEMPNLSVAGIAGPGDALADFDNTRKTLQLIREYDKDITFCISTNGLMLPVYAEELLNLDVTHVTVTMNAVDPEISAGIYKYIDYMGMRLTGETAAAVLLRNQLAGLGMLIQKGVVCKVNIVTLKGINDHHIPDIVKKVKETGCYIVNIMPFIPVKGSEFERLPPATPGEVCEIRKNCEKFMLQMHHCRQCRADAAGTL